LDLQAGRHPGDRRSASACDAPKSLGAALAKLTLRGTFAPEAHTGSIHGKSGRCAGLCACRRGGEGSGTKKFKVRWSSRWEENDPSGTKEQAFRLKRRCFPCETGGGPRRGAHGFAEPRMDDESP